MRYWGSRLLMAWSRPGQIKASRFLGVDPMQVTWRSRHNIAHNRKSVVQAAPFGGYLPQSVRGWQTSGRPESG
jgi:hypothetical protein